MATDQSLWEQVLAKRAEWASEQPSLGAQIRAMTREAAKDVHNTLNQVFFSGHSGPGEPGAPLNPTPQMVTQDLDVMGGYRALLDGYSGNEPAVQRDDKGMER
jgi:hypothetical protein